MSQYEVLPALDITLYNTQQKHKPQQQTFLFVLSKFEGQNFNFVSAAVNAATLLRTRHPVKDLTADWSLRSVFI